MALTAPSSSFSTSCWEGKICDASKAIISSTRPSRYNIPSYAKGHITENERMEEYYNDANWEVLGFNDIGFNELTDDDIGALLVCIDAKNKLKTLRLSYCEHMNGYGLEPLIGSTVLEHIDLRSKRKGLLSLMTTIPILDRIVGIDGNSMREVHLPNEWKKKHRNESPLSEFLVRFNTQMSRCIQNGKVVCKQCKKVIEDTESSSCFTCFMCICNDCDSVIEEHDDWVSRQNKLKRCDHCNLTFCVAKSCGDFKACDYCNAIHCSLCSENEHVNAPLTCGGRAGRGRSEDCYPCCTDCMLGLSPENECTKCLVLHFPKLAARNKNHIREITELQKELDGLRKENGELRKQAASHSVAEGSSGCAIQ